jgi:hypothetical protein
MKIEVEKRARECLWTSGNCVKSTLVCHISCQKIKVVWWVFQIINSSVPEFVKCQFENKQTIFTIQVIYCVKTEEIKFLLTLKWKESGPKIEKERIALYNSHKK